MEYVVSDQRKYKSMIVVFIMCACVLLAGRVAGELSVIDNVVTIPASDANDRADGKNKGETRVATEHGDVRGHLDQSDILTYFDIPYGAFGEQQPFQEPTPPTQWADVHDKSSHSSRCPQIREGKFEGNNECLTLTVMKQKDANNADVLLHIHDNSFTSGSGDPAVYSPKYIVPKGVILVLPNYRLGPLGFLCLQNSTAPGNAGLKDLTLALQWTQNNIEAFGGNSTNIVVSGGGAAGALVEFLLLSNSSNKFISKAITESGSALSPWAVDRNPLDTANLFLRNLTKDQITMEPNRILQNADLEVITRAGAGIEFRPCVESENGFMVQSPWVTLQNAKFNFSYMTGSANQAAMAEVLALTNENLSEFNRNVAGLLPNDLCFKDDNEELSVALKVKALYFGDHDIYENNKEKLSLCFSDSQYLNGVIRAARLLARGGSQVYFYEFSVDNSSPFNGSARGDSLHFIFGTTDYDNIGTNKNIIRDLMIHLWTSFIKYGIPEVENIEWNTLQYGEPAEERWLSIGSKVQMRSGLHADRLTLWNGLYELHYVEGNWAYRLKPTAFRTIYRAVMSVLAVHLLPCEVTGRIALGPPARHRVLVTTQGSARGYFVPRPPHYSFLGLPYARAPTLYDRFKSPEPPPPWSGIFEAVHRVKCPQPDGSGDENCLVVNVFTPEHAVNAPVIVHIHDGGFQSGWGTFTAPARLLERGFVFISMNYRIGALGFLSLGIEDVLGNAGIKDQVAALYWINRNVEKFGGDPSDVTVYGTGSGAVSIELLLLSGLTKNLFHKAILESGSTLSPSSITRNPGSVAYNLAKTLGHRGDSDIESLREYFYKVPVKVLTNISRIFRPCIEKVQSNSHNLLDRDPSDILQDGMYQHVPMMIVYTHAEEVDILLNGHENFESMIDNIEDLLPNNLIFDNDDVKNQVLKLIKNFYFEDVESTGSVAGSVTDYINDVYMEYPIARSASYHANGNPHPVYLMKFGEHTSKDGNRHTVYEEYNKIFRYITSDQLDDSEEDTAKKLVMLWTNFVNLGDPTPLTSPLLPVIWQPVRTHKVNGRIVLQNIAYLQFDETLKNNLLSGQQLKFWDSIYQKFYITVTEQVEN